MKIIALFFITLIPSAVFSTEVRMAQILTGNAESKEGFIFKGGSYFKSTNINHTSFLIRHDNEYILFDAGLGKKIDDQYKKDMPWWGKLIFSYEKSESVADQLQSHNIKINKIFLSHLHWDHASGLVDFPVQKFYVTRNELKEINSDSISAGAFLKSQFSFNKDQWQEYKLRKENYMGFNESYDVFSDKTVVIVPLPGHTKGSVGMIVNTGKKKYFLIGDLVWSKKAISKLAHKDDIPSLVVDGNREELLESLKKVLQFSRRYPDVEIIPAHDEEVQSKFSYFPKWMEEDDHSRM